MKVDKNFLTGTVSLVLTAVFGVLSVKGNLFQVLLFAFLFIAAAVAAVAFYSVVVPNMLKIQPNWFCFAPFTAMLAVSRIFFGWDLFVPFCAVSFTALTYDLFCRIDKKKKTSGTMPAVFILASGVGFVLIFTVISVCGGILL